MSMLASQNEKGRGCNLLDDLALFPKYVSKFKDIGKTVVNLLFLNRAIVKTAREGKRIQKKF
jgi:hypothetical protein